MKAETSQHEPLSPELALVDPELAATARERLPEAPQSYAVPSPSYEFASRLVVEYERAARETGELEEPRRRPRRRRRGRYVALAFTLLALPVALWAMEGRGDDDVAGSSKPAVQTPAPVAPEPPSVDTQTSKGTVRTRTRPARRRTPARRADPSRRRRAAVPKHARSAPVLRWAPVGTATFYWFQLYRIGLPGAQKILDAWPTRARLEVPRVWTNASRRYRLAAGRYRWEVWPQFGSGREVRYTRKIAHGTFRVKR